MLKRTCSFSTVFALLAVGPIAHAADHASGVDGVVRDPHGTPQMGVLVELLRGNVVATTLTDLRGRYHIAQVTPGLYDLRTSGTLFLPTLHRSLLLRDGAPSTFNLTLTGLFDQTGWLTLPHRVSKGDVDDWKWTLRSPANRPMLRVVDESADEASDLPAEAIPERSDGAHGVLTEAARSGAFGTESSGLGLEVGRESSDHRSSDTLLLSAGVAGSRTASSAVSLVAARETGKGQGMQRRMLVGVHSIPQLRTQAADGLTVLEVDSAERMELGSIAAVEVGGQTQVLRSGESQLVLHPFVQVSAQANGVWLISLQYATSPRNGSFDEIDEHQALTRVPTLVQGSTGVQTEAGSHEECAVTRSLGRAHLEIAGFRDAQRRTILTGLLSRQALQVQSQPDANTVVDVSNGSFRKLVQGFAGDGIRVSFQSPLGNHSEVTAAFINGVGMGERQNPAPSGVAITPRRSSSVYVAVKREIARTGTQFAVSYRWQPASMLTTVGLYEVSEINPYLGLHLVQLLPGGKSSGWRTELIFDANNALAEGYRMPQGSAQETQYMSALQEMRAGLAVTF